MAKKYINSIQLQKQLFARTEGYAANVRKIYLDSMQQIIDLVKGTELEDDKPFSFTDYGYSEDVTPILKKLYSRVYQEIRGNVEKEWMLSNANNDELVKSVFDKHAIEDNHFAKYFNRNKEAMDAFFSRKTGEEGLNLSQKVWKYNGQFREELETCLDLAIGEGTGADKLASKIKDYLQDPDKFYRRFRVKTGEDENGNPVYGRIWKRRVFDKEDQAYRWVNDTPKKYHPGQGVYRSSYRNAQRLARTETNIAYRTADYERWQQLDFVVGVEIKLSNNHPVTDICDDLKGIYPKDFKWTGWHPNCRCYMIPVLATQDEMDKMIDKILSDETNNVPSENQVEDYPNEFKAWIKNNEERMSLAKEKGTLPYFVKDNAADIGTILKPLTPEQKYHQDLVKKYGEDDVKKLYDAFDGFKTKISTGDLAFQVKKLSFETDWVGKNGKYPTSPEMVKMLEKELATVQAKLDTQQAVDAANSILGYKSKSKPLNSILEQLNASISNGSTAKEIQDLTAQATAKICEIEKARLLKVAKSVTADGSTIDLYATAEEKLEIARLQDQYDKLMSKYSNQWNSEVNHGYQQLANYKKDLAEKYLDKQGVLMKNNGETTESAAKALKEYLDAPVNHEAMSPVGGRFQDLCADYDKQRIKEYSKLTGISEDELGLITRYTYGSKWCNTWGYDKINDYGGLCQKYYPATNSAMEKLPRFQGTTFSGIDFSSMDLDKYVQTMKKCLSTGEPYINPAFVSSTTNIEKTTIFGRNCQLVINGKKGVDVRRITHMPYESEAEVLFRAGSKFKVTAVYQEATRKYGFGQGWVIELEEL